MVTYQARKSRRERTLLSRPSTGPRQIASGVAPLMLVFATVYKGPFFTNTAKQRRTGL